MSGKEAFKSTSITFYFMYPQLSECIFLCLESKGCRDTCIQKAENARSMLCYKCLIVLFSKEMH